MSKISAKSIPPPALTKSRPPQPAAQLPAPKANPLPRAEEPTSLAAASVIGGLQAAFRDIHQPDKPVPLAPKIQGGTPQQKQLVQSGLELLARSPTGKRELELVRHFGVELKIDNTANGAAHYNKDEGKHGAVTVPASFLTEDRRVAGLLGHEFGHALVDKLGIRQRLDQLPNRLGRPSNEVVAEALASAIAREAGFRRGESAISSDDGSLRTPLEGLDKVLASKHYVESYKLDLKKIEGNGLRRAYDVVREESIGLIEQLGGTPPPEYLTFPE